ncbi:MAG: fatty-acyl-CoA synthase [Gammaproteobacteria bacterium]|jgi:fatty-acyl-CoA synthase
MEMPTARTAAGLLAQMAQRFPDQEAFVDHKSRYTYAQWRSGSRQLAKGLYAIGVRPGDHVAILAGNVAEWLLVDFAIASLGATMVPINTWATPRELSYLFAHSQATCLVHADKYLGTDYVEVFAQMQTSGLWPEKLNTRVCIGKPCEGAVSFEALYTLGEPVDDAVIDACERAVKATDVACLLYTSGSTAVPKGVPLQHGSLIENMWNIGARQRLNRDDRLWLAVSLFWSFGCVNALFAMLTHGVCIVLQALFDPAQALRLIERERCTVFYGTPNMTLALLEHPERERYDLSSLRTGLTIGTPDQVRMAIELGVRDVCNVYGLTETYGNAAVTDAHAPVEQRIACQGEPLPGNELIIVDPQSGRVLAAGEVGEIRVRGYVTPNYFNDPHKNAESFDADGFFLTGDLGFLDNDGCVHFRGRCKEMIKTGGINVAPAEVEESLAAFDGVAQAYVVGLPDSERDELVAAVLVLDEGAHIDVDELKAYCRERLAAYKVPRRFRIATDAELPLTSTRKLQKMRLPELFD